MKMLKKKSVGQRRVYDIEVEDVHNFYANGINVHNCATDGGVSVIKDDGTVVDLTHTVSTSNASDIVVLPSSGGIRWATREVSSGFVYVMVENDIPTADKSTAPDAIYANFGQASLPDLNTVGTLQHVAQTDIAVAGGSGLTIIDHNPTAPTQGMVAYTTSEYATGYMVGDIKGAFLSDTDDTDLVGSGELVTNGTFDTDTDWTKGPGWTISGGVAAHSQASGGGALSQTLSLVAGKTYVISATIDTTGDATIANSSLGIRNAAGTSNIATTVLSPNTSKLYTATFIATETNSQVWIYSADDIVSVDNISVKLADEDRSVNSNGLVIEGSIARDPVASGADLVAYSGFSA